MAASNTHVVGSQPEIVADLVGRRGLAEYGEVDVLPYPHGQIITKAWRRQRGPVCANDAPRNYRSGMDADAALIQAWELGMDEAGWTDAVMDEAERLLPILIQAGYAATDAEKWTWWFTDKGVARAEELERITGSP
jgi:hypothetical protein